MFEGKVSVTANVFMGPSAFLLRMRAPALAREAEPGQFVLLRVSTTYDPLLRRPFSICRAEGEVVEVLYKVVGRGTSLLSEVGPGEEIEVMGPLGRGFTPPRGTPLLVAGGIGIAPLVFWAGKLRYMGHEPEVLLGAATSGGLFGRKLLADAGARVKVATEDGSEGFAGTVTELLRRVLEPSHHVYACGPRGMLREVVALTEEMGVPCEISVEEVMACGVGACMGCAVGAREGGYLLVCRDGPVFEGKELVL